MRPVGSYVFLKLSVLFAGSMMADVSASLAEPSQIDMEEVVSLPKPTSSFVNTADLVVTTAEEVVTDVQSVLFAPRFQRGEMQGYRYVLFPDGSAKVYDVINPQEALLTIQCSEGVSCLIEGPDGLVSEVRATGAARPDAPVITDAPEVANHLAQWVLAGTGTPPVQVVPKSEDADPTPLEIAEVVTVVDGDTDPTPLIDAPETIDEQPSALVQEEVAVLPVTETTEQPSETPEFEDCPEQGQFVPTACTQPVSAPSRIVLPHVAPAVVGPSAMPEPVQVPSDPAPLSFADEYKLKCSITGSATLSYENAGSQAQRPGKPRVSLGCSASLTEKLSVRVALIHYAIPEQQEDFDPDFTYAFTYRINDKISLGYSNYSGRFSGSGGGFLNALTDGNLRASFRLPKITLPNEKNIACSASLGLPNPADASANLSCGYSITNKLRIGGTAYLYLPASQGEYDPDFSYTASYRVDENWLVSYSNYSNNRWSWNPSESPGPGFGGGTLSATYSFKF